MWVAQFEGSHDSCTLAPLCIKHKVVDHVYLLNAWQDNVAFYYSEAHILQGEEKAVKAFIEDIKKSEETIEVESKADEEPQLIELPELEKIDDSEEDEEPPKRQQAQPPEED